MCDPITISYLKGEITFEHYANIIENQNLRNELLNENFIENSIIIDESKTPGKLALEVVFDVKFLIIHRLDTKTESSNKFKSSSSKKLERIFGGTSKEQTTVKKVNFNADIASNVENNNEMEDIEEEDDDEIWRNFDVGTLDFNKFIDSSYMDNEDSQNAMSSKNTRFPKQLPMTPMSSMSRKKRKEAAASDEDLAEIKSKRRVTFFN